MSKRGKKKEEGRRRDGFHRELFRERKEGSEVTKVAAIAFPFKLTSLLREAHYGHFQTLKKSRGGSWPGQTKKL